MDARKSQVQQKIFWTAVLSSQRKHRQKASGLCVQSQDYPLEGTREELEQSCAYFSFVTGSLFWGPSALAAWGTLFALNGDSEGTLSLRYTMEQIFVIYTPLSHFQMSKPVRNWKNSFPLCFWKQSCSSLLIFLSTHYSVKRHCVDLGMCDKCYHESDWLGRGGQISVQSLSGYFWEWLQMWLHLHE